MQSTERYEFTWIGKRQSILDAATPTRKTLRPCVEESKNWDTTENLYIEGDNLDVLKLLQESNFVAQFVRKNKLEDEFVETRGKYYVRDLDYKGSYSEKLDYTIIAPDGSEVYSAATAHAVMQLNAEDGGHRIFIMVQLPEECAKDSEACKAGYATICEIGKERIRRAGEKILKEQKSTPEREHKPDVSFKVFKLNSTAPK
jgi:adenine specific DNA methylase Mod